MCISWALSLNKDTWPQIHFLFFPLKGISIYDDDEPPLTLRIGRVGRATGGKECESIDNFVDWDFFILLFYQSGFSNGRETNLSFFKGMIVYFEKRYHTDLCDQHTHYDGFSLGSSHQSIFYI